MSEESKKASEKSTVPPYMPYKTFYNFIESLQQGVPGRIDRSLMRTMSGGVQRNLMTTLKYLKLISDKGIPTEELSRLVNSEGPERKNIIEELLESSYSFLFSESFDLSTATMHQLEDQFKNTGAGGGTIRKCIKFFTEAAKDTEIVLSPYLKKIERSSKNSAPKTRRITSKKASKKPEIILESTPQTKQLSWTQLLLSKFPSFDPSWSDEIKAKWFDGFDLLMKRGEEDSEEGK